MASSPLDNNEANQVDFTVPTAGNPAEVNESTSQDSDVDNNIYNPELDWASSDSACDWYGSESESSPSREIDTRLPTSRPHPSQAIAIAKASRILAGTEERFELIQMLYRQWFEKEVVCEIWDFPEEDKIFFRAVGEALKDMEEGKTPDEVEALHEEIRNGKFEYRRGDSDVVRTISDDDDGWRESDLWDDYVGDANEPEDSAITGASTINSIIIPTKYILRVD
ncbi:hypothetical protein BJ508DRAFT_327509 [Ascobolus immersus RN42]|uniref:Uncharacterized protein n=1 Tax=Ascobolus immersus RN42 TaxID=1160509 RepID=A0A3N4I687_ASCIM|nr:hypothetical protein BJ508DRAFT_327509 [Ascobolus immersus RN42]